MTRVFKPDRVEAGLWLTILCGLITGIGIETDWGRRLSWPLPEFKSQSTSLDKPELTELFLLPPSEKFIDISLRPVFVVTRAPAPIPPPPEAPKPKMQKDQFILTGVTIVADAKFAHLTEKLSKKSYVVAEGKEINGLFMKEIAPDQVTLAQYGDMERLILRTAKALPLPVAGIPAASLPLGESGATASPSAGIAETAVDTSRPRIINGRRVQTPPGQ